MRNLNIEELSKKIFDYALSVEYVDKQHLNKQLNQFLNFLYSQSISERVLQRIGEDFAEIKESIPTRDTGRYHSRKEEFLETIETPDKQGALGFFVIDKTFKTNSKGYDSYLDLANEWCDSRGDYDQYKNDFNSFLFKPFVELLKWYIEESQSHDSNDYFSKREVDEFSDKLDDLTRDIRLGQEVLFEEIQDLKEQLKNLKKKNWGELLKGKLLDLTLSKIISIETFSIIVKSITGETLNFLDK